MGSVVDSVTQLWEFLTAAFGPMGPFFALGGVGALLVALSIPALLRRKADPLDKLNVSGHDRRDARLAAAAATKEDGGNVRLRYDGGAAGRLEKFAPYLEPKDQKELGANRLKLIQAGYFPDALDLMLVCVEAGQSLDQAIMRVSKEIRGAYPTLAEEFELVSSEMRAGKDRSTVLRDMSERCGVPDISSFVTVLVQSATFGTSISDALRVYASEMRDKRVMRAEEKANVLPTKLTIGTMLFTVPPLLIILVGPSIYDIYVNLLGG